MIASERETGRAKLEAMEHQMDVMKRQMEAMKSRTVVLKTRDTLFADELIFLAGQEQSRGQSSRNEVVHTVYHPVGPNRQHPRAVEGQSLRLEGVIRSGSVPWELPAFGFRSRISFSAPSSSRWSVGIHFIGSRK